MMEITKATAELIEAAIESHDRPLIEKLCQSPDWNWVIVTIKFLGLYDNIYCALAYDYKLEILKLDHESVTTEFYFNDSVINFIENFVIPISGDNEIFSKFHNLSVLALRYTIIFRKNHLIKNGTYPICTSTTLPYSRILVDRFNYIESYDKKQEYWETSFLLGLAETMNPRMSWATNSNAYSNDSDFQVITSLIYHQERSTYCEKLDFYNDEFENFADRVIQRGESYDFRYDSEFKGPLRTRPLIEIVQKTIGCSKRSVLADRLRIVLKLYSNDDQWVCIPDRTQFCYYINKKQSRIAFTTNMECFRALSYAVKHGCNELCFSQFGDYITVINISEAMDQFNLLMALCNGDYYPYYSDNRLPISYRDYLKSLYQ